MRTISENKVSRNTNNASGFSNKCRRIRTWLNKALNSRFGLDASWVQNHIASCPRCQRRLAAIGKVNLALSAMKAQPHRTDLLMRANIQAIGVLKHSLRQAPKAHKLKVMLPEPKLLERWQKYAHPAANLAACIAILFLMKVGIFSSMDKFQAEGQKAVKQYYANHAGQDMANEIFSA
jgi:anti-sigma factor RsiW